MRSAGVKQMTAQAAQPAISVQNHGASGPDTSMATTSAPEPPGNASVKRSHPKK